MVKMMISPLTILTWREWLAIVPLIVPSATINVVPLSLKLKDTNVVESDDARGEVQVMTKEESWSTPRE